MNTKTRLTLPPRAASASAASPQVSSKPDLGVFIGRFQPLHCAHEAVIKEGLDRCQYLLVLVGSSRQPRSTRNPFTTQERIEMIERAFGNNPRLIVKPLEDSDYNLNDWIERTTRAAQETLEALPLKSNTGAIALVGHAKDATSYYLNLFPSWRSIDVAQSHPLSATDIREEIFGGSERAFALLDEIEKEEAARRANGETVDKGVPTGEYQRRFHLLAHQNAKDFLAAQRVSAEPSLSPSVITALGVFIEQPAYRSIADEYAFVAKYRYAWRHAPYAPTFVTADAVVVQSGHILLLRRRAFPGRGQWALPGGFVDQNESIEQACLRELREEAGLKVPDPVLRGSIKRVQVFDAPHRSSRGRTITHAHLISLAPGPLPKIKQIRFNDKTQEGNDAESMALDWVPLAGLRREDFFEDHYAIIKNMVAYL